MSLKDQLTQKGSKYSKYNGASIPTNKLATKQSELHADPSGMPGYSLDGGFTTTVSTAYQKYDDGDAVNVLPNPSRLDVNGVTPKTALKDVNTPSINNSFSKGTYIGNFPE